MKQVKNFFGANSPRFKKAGILFLVVLILTSGIFYGGFQLGYSKKVERGGPLTEDSLPDADFSLFWDSVELVKNKYFRIGEIEDETLLYGAIKGVLGALDDPYSTFFNPSDSEKLNQDLNGSFGGIGAEIGIRNSQLLVIAPLKGNPAEAAGLKAGDKILKVDETITNDLSVDEAVKIIRGEPGTVVVLLIFRDGWDEAREFKITRDIIRVPTLDWENVDSSKTGGKRIAHVRLYNFNANAPQLFYENALQALLRGTDGIILDLRNNPGGFLEVSTDIASWFLKRGEIVVKERFRSGNSRDFRANGNSALSNLPIVILVNGGSASASEILAGALRDNRGVKLIGEKTFGKGTVQEVDNLKNGASLKISVAEWLTPNGNEIEKKGLTPDIEVKPDVENEGQAEIDAQLEKAIEVLSSEIKESQPQVIIL